MTNHRMSYTKLFHSILDSTIWDESDATVRIWFTLLAMCDKDGEVHASLPGLARRARKTREEVIAALEVFMSPDPDSSSQVAEGRRIERIDGGWRLINHRKYRDMSSIEDKRERWAKAQAKAREKKRAAAQSSDRLAREIEAFDRVTGTHRGL